MRSEHALGLRAAIVVMQPGSDKGHDKVIGDKTLKLYTVHVVDKDKQLFKPAP